MPGAVRGVKRDEDYRLLSSAAAAGEPEPEPEQALDEDDGSLQVQGTKVRLAPRDGDGEAFDPEAQYFCVVGTAPAEKQCSLISILLEERGWKEWPSEDWFVSEAGEMLRRPKDAKGVGFCNCASYSTVVVDVPGSDWAYDRLLLADLCGHNAPEYARICPPSYKIKKGELVGDERVDPLWNGEEPCMWFLKENSRNYGQGIDICATEEQALQKAREHEAAEPGAGREFVLQPHIIRPLLFEDTYKFHIRVYLMIMVSPCLRYPRGLAHVTGKMPISNTPWSDDDLDKGTQITTARSVFRYEDWEHYPTVHNKLLALTAILVERMEPKLGPSMAAKRAGFELLGLDYMVDTDMNGWLLEVNTGPVLKVEDDMELIAGITEMIFGPEEAPLGLAERGSGQASHGWVEINTQQHTKERRECMIAKLVTWMTQRTSHPDCTLCLEEELVHYCADELGHFLRESEEGAAAVEAGGAVDACVSCLADAELDPTTGQRYALLLLASLFDRRDVVQRHATVDLLEVLTGLMDGDSEELQALATSIATHVLNELNCPLPSVVAGSLMGSILWQLDSPNPLVAECAASCIGVMVSEKIAGAASGDAIVQLGGAERLRQLAGLYDDNPDSPSKLKQAAGAEDSEDDECRLREVAMDALRCIADAQKRTEQLELAARQERENAETECAEAGVASSQVAQ